MNKKTELKVVVVRTIRQAAGRLPGMPGNIIINSKDEVKPEHWFSARELRNSMLGAGLPTGIPVYLLKGSTITYERLEVTEDDLKAGNGSYKHSFPGKDRDGNPRVVEYKQAGIHNINAQIDLGTMPWEVQMGIADLGMKHAVRRPMVAAPATTETLTDENVAAPADTPAETIKHESLTGEKVGG